MKVLQLKATLERNLTRKLKRLSKNMEST